MGKELQPHEKASPPVLKLKPVPPQTDLPFCQIDPTVPETYGNPRLPSPLPMERFVHIP